MRLGIFAKTFPGHDPDDVLRAVAAAGYTTTQYNMVCSGLPSMPDEIPASGVQAVAAAARALDIKIVALSGTYNMIHPDRSLRRRGLSRLAVLASAAAGISSPLITLCTGTRDPDNEWRAHPDNNEPDAWKDLLEQMVGAVAIAEQFGVDLGIEPELANVVNSAAKARRLIDEIGSQRLKIILDPANLFEVVPVPVQRDIVSASLDLLADRIVMAHAKDRAPDGSFTIAGSGVLDYPHFLGCLSRTGFKGSLVTHGLTADAAASVAVFLRQMCAAAGVAVAP